MRMIYLAGGLKTNWQQHVMDQVDAGYLDPMTIQHLPLAQVAATELQWLDRCDAVFAYFEATNPTGHGLAAEIGYARALGKYIILVTDGEDRRVRWLQHLCDECATSFDDGIARLQAYLQRQAREYFKSM